MGIRSFLVHVSPGARERVAAVLEAEPGCEVLAAENRDVVVLVADHEGRETEEVFDRWLGTLADVTSVALVSGFGDPGEERSSETGKKR